MFTIHLQDMLRYSSKTTG